MLDGLKFKMAYKTFTTQPTKRIHIISLLFMFIAAINIIIQLSETRIQTVQITEPKNKFQYLGNLYIFSKLKKDKIMKTDKSYKKLILLILILLSNDVNINPGPPPVNHTPDSEKCNLCNAPANNEDSLKCETCSKWCHITCSGNQNRNLHNSYEWICSNPTCSPNHIEGMSHEVQHQLVSPNRYNLLERAERVQIREKATKKTPKAKAKLFNHKTNEDMKLLNELTSITPGDYVGKDLCRSCHKEVKTSHQAISCDLCQRWIHRSCSDMNTSLYNNCKKKKHFQWTCNKCRVDEEENHDRPEVAILKDSEMPENATSIKSSSKEMTIVHLNCRSIVNKVEELELVVEQTDADIIVLTETWMDDSVPQQACIPEGYSIIRKDRGSAFKQKYGRNKGGGIAILHKEYIKVERKKYLTDNIEEILWVHVKIKSSFMLGAVYRPEYSDIMKNDGESIIEENIRKATEITNNIIITGDFNIDMSDPTHKNTQLLTDIYETYGLKQYIKKPTRIDKTTSKPTIIDHIWASKEMSIINNTGTFHGISDHMGVYMKLNKKKPVSEKEIIKFRDYRKYDATKFNTSLKQNLEDSLILDHLNTDNVNSATTTLIKVIQQTAEQHAPLVEVNNLRRKKHLPWFSKQLKEMIKIKNELLSDFYCHSLTSYKPRIASLTNKINQMKRNLKRKFINEKMDEAKEDSNKCWKLLNYITYRKKSKKVTEPEMMTQDKADKYNNFFATIGIEIQKQLGVNHEQCSNPHEIQVQGNFKFSEENESTIGKLIDRIKTDVATGDDNIGARLIKDAKTTISPILTKIINKGYLLNTFPDCMKRAVIKPIHKKESTDDISNYRPISILPILSKVFERAAVDQLVEYLETNKLLCKNQHAYRKKHSTVTCLVEVLNYVYALVDKGRRAAIASLDLSKAFDSISHKLILKKLANLGLDRNSIMWIKSYLTNRKQVTKFKNFISKEGNISSGIPQGSIMGPLLFLCFTNDLAAEFENICLMMAYADDTQLIIDASNLNQLKNKIEQVITIAQCWYQQNTMKNNIGKTELLLINTSMKNEKIKVNIQHEGKRIMLESKPYIKVLGILIDSKLNWTKQVNSVKRNAMNATRNIHRVNNILPTKHRVTLYKSVISPLFSYADIIWGGCGTKDSQSLQRVQNFAAKSITGNRKYDSATASLRQLKFLNLQQRRQVHESVFTHKALLNENTESINQLYSKYLSTANTRQSDQRRLTIPKHKTARFEKSPLYRSIVSWNSCPTHLPFDNLKQHKTQLQRHMIKLNSLSSTAH